jgi:hypothetical protein
MASGLTVFVLIDALGWPYAQGFLADLLPFRKPLRTVLGYSSGAIPTILTGLPPNQTGHWNLFYYDPDHSPFRWLRRFKLLPDGILDHRVTRKFLKESGRHVLGLGPLFECCVSPRLLSSFDWIEKRNIYAPGGLTCGRSIFDSFVEAGVSYHSYSYHAGSDAALLKAACRDLREDAASFYFVYLSEMDAFLHHHCTEPENIRKKLAWYSSELTNLFRLALEADPKARLAVASDHGMTPVRHRFDLVSGLEGLGLAMPEDYLAVYDSTMARFWFFKNGARGAITEYLKRQSCGRILTDAELGELGTLFGDRRYGQMIFLLNPGCMLGRSDFNGRGWNPTGMHGYHPDDSNSDGIFLCNGEPGVTMRSIADLHTWMTAAGG